MNEAILQAQFDELVERFNNADDAVTLEDIHRETRNLMQEFLEAGFDANQIAKMLSLEDSWEYWDLLEAHGANIDLIDEWLDEFDVDFIKKHWKELIERGATVETLIERRYSNFAIDWVEAAELLDLGVDEERALEEICYESFYYKDLEKIAKGAAILREHGLSESGIDKFVRNCAAHNRLIWQSIMEWDSEEWEKSGIKASDYVNEWLEYFKKELHDNGPESGFFNFKADIPKDISLQKFIDSLSIKELLELNQGLLRVLLYETNFISAGGNVDYLAQKFLNEVGYSNEADAVDIMEDFIIFGTQVIDVSKFIECVNSCDLDRRGKEEIQERLEPEMSAKIILS